MKALLIKDLKMIVKTLKLYLFIILCYAPLGALQLRLGYSQIFPVILGSVLPLSAMAYDERFHWDRYCLTLPVSRRDIVLSKYLLSLGFAAAIAVYTLLVNLLIHVLAGASADTGAMPSYILLFTCVAITFININLPITFLLGTEKGRLVYLASMVFVIIFSGTIPQVSSSALGLPMDVTGLALTMTVINIPLTAVSFLISLSVYRKKELS